MNAMMKMVDFDLGDTPPVIETARPKTDIERVGFWFESFIEEFERANMDFDPLIDYPRDL